MNRLPWNRLRHRARTVAMAASLWAGSACNTSYEFEPTELGQDRSDGAAKLKNNAQFIRGVYSDLLGRNPTRYDFLVKNAALVEVSRFPVDEQALLLTALDSSGDPHPMRALMIAGLVDASEAGLPVKSEVDPAAFITDQFHRFLGRDPSLYERAQFLAAWQTDPNVGPKEVVRALIMSREYQSN